MARGKQEHEARTAVLNSFGKELARRAKSKCELCERGGERLAIFEVPPVTREPDLGRCLLLCGDCLAAGEHWRFLAEQAWSGNLMVQVMAVRLLRRQGAAQHWAREALDGLFLDEEVDSLVTEAV